MRKTTIAWCVLGLALAFFSSGCTTNVYKNEIGVFKTSVDNAVDAFESLRNKEAKRVSDRFEQDLAAKKAKVETVGDCTSLVTDRLQKDSACLAQWSSYRAAATVSRRDPPSCQEPATDPSTHEFTFYEIGQVALAEMEFCRLGIRDGDIVRPEKLNAGGVLENTSQLGRQLKIYAESLAALADANDSEELKSAVGDAKTALEKLTSTGKELLGSKGTTYSPIVPVTDLIGTALIATLETRRFFALKSVVTRGDDVITEAAKLLSRNSMPLMIPRLRAAGTKYLEKTEVFNSGPSDEAWIEALAEARQAKDSYLALYDAHPTGTFRAMAEAHSLLRKELENPDKRFDQMKAAINDFAAKAKTAREAFSSEKP